jgi:hypothetical protein
MSPSMRQSIEQVRFVSINNSTAIILSFSNRAEMLGGFLSWENRMPRELARLYDYADVTGEFADIRIGDYDIRQLIASNENEIVYTIANDNTAIIATNATDLVTLLESINQP